MLGVSSREVISDSQYAGSWARTAGGVAPKERENTNVWLRRSRCASSRPNPDKRRDAGMAWEQSVTGGGGGHWWKGGAASSVRSQWGWPGKLRAPGAPHAAPSYTVAAVLLRGKGLRGWSVAGQDTSSPGAMGKGWSVAESCVEEQLGYTGASRAWQRARGRGGGDSSSGDMVPPTPSTTRGLCKTQEDKQLYLGMWRRTGDAAQHSFSYISAQRGM